MITAPGMYDLPTEAYHRDPVKNGSLSHSGSKKLLISPAHFKAWRDGDQKSNDTFDLGKAAHAQVLGVGEEIAVVDAADWKTNEAKAARAAAYARGAVPILTKQAEQVAAMATRLQAHPLASRLLAPGTVLYEQTIVWHDPETGVWCRLMTDAIRAVDSNGVRIILDYKTRSSQGVKDLDRELFNFGYFGQGAWYDEGVRAMEALGALPAAVETRFVLVLQEKDPPYAVTCVPLHPHDLAAYADQHRDMRRLYAECVAADRWPEPGEDDFVEARMPTWGRYQLADAADARAAAREDIAA